MGKNWKKKKAKRYWFNGPMSESAQEFHNQIMRKYQRSLLWCWQTLNLRPRLVLEAAATECVVLLQGLIGSVGGTEEPREYLTCPVCGRCITGKNCRQNLRHHLLIHTGEKPYTCPHCPHRANYKPNLLKHIRSVHGSSQGQPLSSGSFSGVSSAPAAPAFLPTSANPHLSNQD